MLTSIPTVIPNWSIFTPRKQSLGQGNIFAPVCHSVHGGGGAWSRGSAWPRGVPGPGGGLQAHNQGGS